MASVLRINIGGTWSVRDFAEFAESLDDLYNLSFLILDSNKADTGTLLSELLPMNSHKLREGVLSMTSREETFRIVQVEYASPGFSDLTGIGEVMKQLKETLFGIIDRVQGSTGRKADVEERQRRALREDEVHRADLQRRTLENRIVAAQAGQTELTLLRELEQWLTKNNRSPSEFHQLMSFVLRDQESIGRLITSAKITSVEDIRETEKTMVDSAG